MKDYPDSDDRKGAKAQRSDPDPIWIWIFSLRLCAFAVIRILLPEVVRRVLALYGLNAGKRIVES